MLIMTSMIMLFNTVSVFTSIGNIIFPWAMSLVLHQLACHNLEPDSVPTIYCAGKDT